MKKIIEFGKLIVRNSLKLTPYGRAYYARRKEAQREEVIRDLHTYGPEILKMVHDAFRNAGLKYYVTDGTLLGVVREGSILPHDVDVDFTIMPNTVSPEKVLEIGESLGFKFFWAWSYDGKVGNIAFEYKRVHVDFDFLMDGEDKWAQLTFTKLDGKSYVGENNWSVVEQLRPKVCGVREYVVSKYGIKVYVPEDYEGYLTAEYGNWKISDPKWREKNVGQANSIRRLLPLSGIRVCREQLLKGA